MKQAAARISALIEPTVKAFGLELWGVEHLSGGGHTLLRIYLESERGIGIDDCERVSRQLSALFEVEQPLAGDYTLEVSSPGIERPLFSGDQFARYIGAAVRVRMKTAVDGRRTFRGTVGGVSSDGVLITVDGEDIVLDPDDMERAALVYRQPG